MSKLSATFAMAEKNVKLQEGYNMQPEDPIQSYLNRIEKPLIGVAPESVQKDLRDETGFHLESLKQDFILKGYDEQTAVQKAIETHGVPEPIGQDCLYEWFEGQAKGTLAKKFGRANLIAFLWFAIAEVGLTFLLMARVYLPSESVYQTNWSPAELRRFFPDPLPYPELTWSFLAIVAYVLLAPIIVGAICGLLIPVRATKAVALAMVPILVYSLLVGVVFQPIREGLVYTLFQIAFWLPVGCLAAHISSTFASSLRYRRTIRHNVHLST